MTTIHPACQAIKDEIAQLERELQMLSAELKAAAPGEKPFIAAQIKKLTAKISARRNAFNRCMAEHPLPTPVTSVLTGMVGIWYRPAGAAGYFTPVSLSMTFSGLNYANVSLQVQPLVFAQAAHVPMLGNIDIIVTTAARPGAYNRVTHNISIPLTLTFSPPGWVSGFWSGLFPTGPTAIPLIAPGLTTLTVQAPFDPNEKDWGLPWNTAPGPNQGLIRLVGYGQGSEGFFGNNWFCVEIRGTMLPVV
jgi:hypothetical protein